MSALQPSPAILVKLGSIAVHVEEYFAKQGHAFDKITLTSLLQDPEIVAWLKDMEELSLLPVKR